MKAKIILFLMMSMLSLTSLAQMSIEKTVSRDTVYHLTLNTTAHRCITGVSGVTVFFTDGTKWERPNQVIGCTEVGDEFKYTARIRLSKREAYLLSTKTVDRFKLYIFESKALKLIP